MASTLKATFNDMLKVYMPYNLLVEEVKKRNYFWNKISKDENWMGGSLQVPFEGGEASSLSYGALTDATDIAESVEVLGTVTDYKDLWGSMIFNEKDLDLHGNLEASFLQILPGKVNQFVSRMSEALSQNLLNGEHICALTEDGAADAATKVDHPERLTIGQKILFADDDSSPVVTAYVTAIDMNTKEVTYKDARSSGSAVDTSSMLVADGAKLYHPGTVSGNSVFANSFASLRNQLLSAANGGGASIFGQTKVSYPILQAQNFDGSSIDANNILDEIFDAFTETITLGKGNPTEIICSFKNFSSIAKVLEVSKRYETMDKKAGYGFRRVSVLGAEGEMDVVGIRDMDDDVMYIMDYSAIKFHGSNFFNRKRHQDGNEFFLLRATTGYQYVVDIRLYGELIVRAPSYCGIIYGISY